MAKDRIAKPFVAITKDKYTIDTIEQLIATKSLKKGDIVRLNGYYDAGDGANHIRKIEESDDGSGVQLSNGLWANIVHNGEVKAGWFGGNSSSKNDYKNNEIQNALDYLRDYEGDLLLDFNSLHWVNTSIMCVWNKTDGYVKKITGKISGEFNNPDEIWFSVGLDSNEYGAISNKEIKGKFDVTGDCKAVLKLFTNGFNSLAFWKSKFNLQLGCRRGYGLWVCNGFFENTIDYLRVDMMRKYLETPSLKIGDESICYVMSNEIGNETISSVKHGYINTWGGKHGVVTTSFSGKYQPDFTADEVHVFDTASDGLRLNNQGKSGCFINVLHAEFIGRPDGTDSYGCFWNGGGTINKIEGGGAIDNCGMVGFLKVYNTTNTPFVCNSFGQPYLLPFKKHIVLVDIRNGSSFVANGYYFNPNNKGDIVFARDSNGTIESTRYIARLSNGNIAKLTDKLNNAYMENEGVVGRLAGKQMDRLGIKNIFTTNEDYESYVANEYFIRFNTTSSASSLYAMFSFFNKNPIERRKLEAYDTASAIKVLGQFFFDMGLARELVGSAFVSAYNIESLNTPYHATKMQQEGVFEDFIMYMDEKVEYDLKQKQQNDSSFMMLSFVEEPKPSKKLLEFAEKYLG